MPLEHRPGYAEPDDADWETFGERRLRTEVVLLAERFRWSPSEVLRLTRDEMASYVARARFLNERDRDAAKGGG